MREYLALILTQYDLVKLIFIYIYKLLFGKNRFFLFMRTIELPQSELRKLGKTTNIWRAEMQRGLRPIWTTRHMCPIASQPFIYHSYNVKCGKFPNISRMNEFLVFSVYRKEVLLYVYVYRHVIWLKLWWRETRTEKTFMKRAETGKRKC